MSRLSGGMDVKMSNVESLKKWSKRNLFDVKSVNVHKGSARDCKKIVGDQKKSVNVYKKSVNDHERNTDDYKKSVNFHKKSVNIYKKSVNFLKMIINHHVENISNR